jgi:hypothetical protein
MESASRRMPKHRSSLPVLPTVVVSVLMCALLALGVTTDRASAKGGHGVFRGTTSQGYPGYIKTSSYGYIIDKATVPLLVECTFGPLLLPQKFQLIFVHPDGRFKETASGVSEEEGVTMQLNESFSGRFNRQHTSVVTKSRLHITFHTPEGSVGECDSGIVTMHAHI